MGGPDSFNGLGDWLCWLETLSPNEIDLGLERVREVLERLNPGTPARVITVAGTNGKGSTVVMLEALLISAGQRVGSYTSPHIRHFNERIRIDGTPVSEDDIVAAFERIESVRQGVALTYFEFGTLAALVIFDDERLDTLILEVGLGGRLDAVNVVDPDACLITNITLDHCDWLGDDVESIAAEKAGVMRADTPVVFGSTEMPEAIKSAAKCLGAELIRAGEDFGFVEHSSGAWTWSGRTLKIDGLVPTALAGQHQLHNAAAVLALIEAIGLTDILQAPTVNAAWATLDLPGRVQKICIAGRTFVVDAAHNADSARVLRESIVAMKVTGSVIVLLGVLAGKDLQTMIGVLDPVTDRWVACTAASARAVPATELARQVAQQLGLPCLIATTVANALDMVQGESHGNDLIVVTGSFLSVAPALDWLDDFRCAN